MKNTFLYIIIAVLGAGLLFFGYKTWTVNKLDTPVDQQPVGKTVEIPTGSISGIITYSGIKPQTGKEGKVYFEYREHNQGEFQKLDGVSIPLVDNEVWNIDGVPIDKTYDARAYIQLNSGNIIAKSNTITVTAPAEDEVFDFNVTLDMIPEYILEKNPVSLGGYVDIQGYIPTNSTISMYAKTNEETNFTEIVENTPVTGARTIWSWDEAVAGTLYQLKTEAYDSNGAIFASSFVGEKAAPSDNAKFIVTSRATDPATTPDLVSISGAVKVNGNFSSNSTVHIKAKAEGETEYTTVAKVSPSNSSVSWTWSEAESGVAYQIKPFLVESGKEDKIGSSISAVAPASNINLILDTNSKPSAPSNEPELTECKQIEGNKYTALITFQNVSGADKYILQVGKSSGSYDVADSVVNNSGTTNPTLLVNINQDQNYYAQYAYTKCEDCDGKSSYSEFSEPLKFNCN